MDAIELYNSPDGSVHLNVRLDKDTIWLSQSQIAALFGVNSQAITRHLNNIYKEGELERASTCSKMEQVQQEGKRVVRRQIKIYNLDAVLSVGYRVNSKQATHFRRWATDVLKRYIVEGSAINSQRLEQLGKTVQVMARISESLESRQILDIVQSYMPALDLLDDYDHQRLSIPSGRKATYVLSYEECRVVIDEMNFSHDSDLFGIEKDDSFKGTIGNIYQSFAGEEIYPSLEEKAANLLYLVVKNHSFLDGNKRIAATMFLYFMDRNNALFYEGEKVIQDSTLVAITVMIAESKPEEKAAMIALVMNFLTMKRGDNEQD